MKFQSRFTWLDYNIFIMCHWPPFFVTASARRMEEASLHGKPNEWDTWPIPERTQDPGRCEGICRTARLQPGRPSLRGPLSGMLCVLSSIFLPLNFTLAGEEDKTYLTLFNDRIFVRVDTLVVECWIVHTICQQSGVAQIGYIISQTDIKHIKCGEGRLIRIVHSLVSCACCCYLLLIFL
jgi:hypothetical protein